MVTHNMFCTYEGKLVFSKENTLYDCSQLKKKCLKQIKQLRSRHMCARISELPSNISRMDKMNVVWAPTCLEPVIP